MRVLFIVRSTLFTVRGGDTIQVEETARHLQKLGIEADIKKTNEKLMYDSYDLLHFFNIIRPADILLHIKKSDKPFVVSTILIDYSGYDKYNRKGFAGKLFRFLSPDGIEYMKTIYRFFRRRDDLVSIAYLWKGQKRSVKEILRKANCVLVQAEKEYTELVRRYNITPPFAIVQNGVNTELLKANRAANRDENLVLCVARVEGIKNQVNLIHAVNNTPYKLLIIGDTAPNQKKYYQHCRQIAGSNISFINYLPQHQLMDYYASAKVHVLPSWFEVCGLSSLEAAAMGCRVVITDRGYASSYFNGDAFYCDPSQPETIRKAIDEAAAAQMNGELQQRVIQKYTWQKAAEKILSVYKKHVA